MQAMASEALPLTATPKWVIQKCATKLTLIYARAPRLKNSVIAYLIVFSEYGMTNANISSVALPLTATPTGKKGGNKIAIYLCRRTKVKITDIAYPRLPRVRTDQSQHLKCGFTHERNAKPCNKMGVTKLTCIYVNRAMLKPLSHRTLVFPSME